MGIIDVNHVTLCAIVSASQTGNGMRFTVAGEGAVQTLIKRMEMAHAATMNGADGWAFAAKPTLTGAILTVTPPDPASITKLMGFCAFGILTPGMHQQQHHWILANGMNPHK